jgi:RNA polymerase sigma factor (sigma-70 family)
VPEPNRLARFEESVLPHLDAAYNLAYWLTRDSRDAEDLVQDAYLRAFRFFDGFRGGSSRAWLLKIVRNTFYTSIQQRAHEPMASIDDELFAAECDTCDPETIALASADGQLLHQAVQELSPEFREVIVLRELEGLSYKEIASVTGAPLGTVMSRLTRARKQLQLRLSGRVPAGEGGPN